MKGLVVLTTHLTLLERLRVPGDEQAWARFVDLYTPLLLLRWAERQGLQASDAADVVQDVLVLLFRKLPGFQYDPHKSFRAWLRTVFLNKCRERWRRAAPVYEPAELTHRPAPEDAAEDREDRRLLLQRGLELIRHEFPVTTWQAFHEYVLCGRPPAEVAAELHLSPGTVYAAKSRILTRLRLDLAGDLEADR